ncbi:hypothetical protein M8998_06990 [Sphingobacterium sp. lm-10]|uniref:hypothetical protein n=1 Tax=Sphingobacterium sp. lm-10 TaxID=2944904 RepID=UPI002020148B|nr:hypothetical protein [Sphingobacterium sp. lm-10]MCL7987679.1 hypothetical protein [Sphingobacterium sp. lm-10]
MTKQEAASALELLHGMGMSYYEVASLCGCTVRELEQLSIKVMSFKQANWQNSNITLTRQSKINWPEELASVS